MIKAEINKNHIKADVSGDIATILSEMHYFVEDTLSSIQNITGESKQNMLIVLTQNILKEWSAENETDGH